ncbi:MAG TPA: lasso RiPP family leader peptide-containing protein [Solirubrobacteraceae bacterium]|nr:lasso RiPP family leader peptide-containing protein [Solirubrobacteraceae bacterium]
MDVQIFPQTYSKPTVVDYGDLRELTAACAGGAGGDAFAPSGSDKGIPFGASNPAYGCKSNP